MIEYEPYNVPFVWVGINFYKHLYFICTVSVSFCVIEITCLMCGPGSSVGIATGYGLDGPGIEFRWGKVFPHLSRPALGPTQPPVQWVPDLSRG
jgi:hypothetical protein